MTKSEAKIIERLAGSAYRRLLGTAIREKNNFPWELIPQEHQPRVMAALKDSSDEVYAILEMANAELGK